MAWDPPARSRAPTGWARGGRAAPRPPEGRSPAFEADPPRRGPSQDCTVRTKAGAVRAAPRADGRSVQGRRPDSSARLLTPARPTRKLEAHEVRPVPHIAPGGRHGAAAGAPAGHRDPRPEFVSPAGTSDPGGAAGRAIHV